ncbi:unnamed protein product [Adineta steineri]|uniref:Uncharacterized protein n=1 Tax=Adineta steineri TaxID=433720 RepID=A0A814M8R4_9BILA|nr:unnamed protein product [Adineta steineri]CAF1074875.1 unnamed protein product [Adineta steineri]CAF1140341.1 unnamed protein product [Adineta steineri]CAF1482379.1 unnamed protein product [Adineta steineri]
MTCYIHLQCNRGSSFACLDWSETCDGIIDCMDGIDEQYCSSIEIHQCYNKQCIPKAFFQDNKNFPDCLDGSDERYDGSSHIINKKKIYEPIFLYEDILCYHILPHINIFHQPTIVKISITFREKALRTNGCAFYLLASPIAS